MKANARDFDDVTNALRALAAAIWVHDGVANKAAAIDAYDNAKLALDRIRRSLDAEEES